MQSSIWNEAGELGIILTHLTSNSPWLTSSRLPIISIPVVALLIFLGVVYPQSCGFLALFWIDKSVTFLD